MNNKEKIEELKKLINNNLSSIIDRDYYLLDLPYHQNIGDSLIWQGEIDFLKQFPYKCKGMHSIETFPYTSIPEGSLILFCGGGNFGDIWISHQNFRMDIIRKYPNNRFLIFPQSVHFQDQENLKCSAEFFSQFDNITICARDNQSYEILKENFKNTILLVPDMAFFIDMKKWRKPNTGSIDLGFIRTDKEFKDSPFIHELISRKDIDILDWPTMIDPLDRETRLMNKLKRSLRIPKKIADLYAFEFYRRYLIHSGVKFLTTHKTIYTTRLHGAILSTLLGKEIVLCNNSYGKNKTFYDTWLTDLDIITYVEG